MRKKNTKNRVASDIQSSQCIIALR